MLLDSQPCRLYMDLEFKIPKINSSRTTASTTSPSADSDVADPAMAAEEEASTLAAAVDTGNRLIAGMSSDCRSLLSGGRFCLYGRSLLKLVK